MPDTRKPDRPARIRGRCTLWSHEAGTVVVARHAELPQVTQERAGGWRTIPRPGLLPVTTWDGTMPLRVRLVLMFDGWSALPRTSVQADVDDLRRLTYRDDTLDRPPTLEAIGAIPYADGGLRPDSRRTPPEWVIETLEIEELLHLPSGRLARAKATLVLLEHIPATIAPRRLETAGKRTYRWRKGDTLSRVAKSELGDSRRAQWIRDANPRLTRLGWSKVKPGTKVTIPRRVA